MNVITLSGCLCIAIGIVLITNSSRCKPKTENIGNSITFTGSGQIRTLSEYERELYERDRANDFASLPEIGKSNAGSDWIYLGFGINEGYDQIGFNWKNRVTGETVSGISPLAPDRYMKIETGEK